jgi:hypothetical protein
MAPTAVRVSRRAPHAEAIAALRAPLDEATRAATDLGLLLGYARAARVGDAQSQVAIEEMRVRWALTDDAPVAALRAHLTHRAAPEAALRARVEALRAAQHEALHDPAWADVVATIAAHAEARAPAETARLEAAKLDEATRALHAALDDTDLGADPEDAAAWRAAMREVWAALDMPWPDAATALGPDALRAALPSLATVAAAREQATAIVEAIDAALDEVLG